MQFMEVLCISQEVPTVRNETIQDCASKIRLRSGGELHATFLDQETGQRPDPVTVARCEIARPKRAGIFVAHIAYEDVLGIRRQIGNIEWLPLAPVFRAYLETGRGTKVATA